MALRSPRLLSLAVALSLWASDAQAILIDFESLAENEILSTQFTGLTFSNGTVNVAGSTLNEDDFPPHSGVKAVIDEGGPISIVFDFPIASFEAYFNYVTQLTLTAYDAANTPIASATSLFSANGADSGEAGSSTNELLAVSSALGIKSVTILGDPAGFSYYVDDVTFTALQAATPVPEPGTILLVLSGAAMVSRRLNRARS